MADDFNFEIGATDNVTKVINVIQNSFNNLGKTVEQQTSKGSIAFASFAGNLAADAAVKAIEIVTDAANALFQTFIVDGVKAASEFEDASNQLAVSLARNGKLVENADDKFKAFANSIQETTKFSDDAALKAGSLIESLTGLSEQGLEGATRAAINLSAALGKDLDSTAQALSRAINGNGEALQKMGIKLRGLVPDANNLDAVLREVNKSFAGSAEAQVNTFSGSIALASNAFNDLQKAIGQVITQNPVVIEIIKAAGQLFSELSEYVKDNADSFKQDLAQGIITAIRGFEILSVAAGQFFNFFNSYIEVVKAPLALLTNSILAIGFALTGNVKAALDAFKENANNTFKSVSDSINKTDSPTQAVTDRLKQLELTAEKAFVSMEKGATATVKPVNDANGGIERLTETAKQLQDIGLSLADNLGKVTAPFNAALEDTKIQAESAQLDISGSFINSLDEQLQAFITYNNQKTQIQLAQNNLELAALEEDHRKKLISEQKYQQSRAILIGKAKQIQDQSLNEQRKFEQKTNQERLSDLSSTFGYIATLQRSSNSTLFAIGKAAAISQATIDGILAVQKALGSAPPPFNFALAALVGVATAANVARIAAAQPPSFARGITEVPAGYGGDSFPAYLNTGERVVPASSNEDLKAFIAENQGSRSILLEISNKLDRLQNQIIVNVGNKEIINEVRAGLADGRSLVPT